MSVVSVIMAIYNPQQEYLREGIRSVLSQTFTDIELILVDDGSASYVREVCFEFIRNDSRVVYHYQENSGCSVARNVGFQLSTGEYILFVDHDDTMECRYVESLLAAVSSGPYDAALMSWFAGCNVENLGAFITFAALIRRSFLESHPDVRFPPGIQPCEDGIFSHKLLAYTKRLVVCPEAVYHWRRHQVQTSNRVNADKLRLLEMIREWIFIVEEFYERSSLSLDDDLMKRHFLRFLENEPFLIRYKKTAFSLQQKKTLYKMIKNAVERYQLSSVVDDSYNAGFVKLVKSVNFFDFFLKNIVWEMHDIRRGVKRFFRNLV